MAEGFVVYHNGRLVPDSEVRVHYTDSGFSYGHTVTDSARTFGHRPFKLGEHAARFCRSMRAVKIDTGLSPAAIERITLDVLDANRHLLDPDQDVWLTQTATGGKVKRAIGTWEFGEPTLIVNVAPLDFGAYAHLYETGVHAVSPSTRAVPPQCLDPKIKHRNRLFFTLAEFEVKEVDAVGFSILLDVDGNLAENKGGNFFVYVDGVLRTPTTRNALAGISRATVLELARDLGIPTAEEDLQPYHVITGEEAFFCSTSYCVMPATKYNGYPVGDGKPGPVVRRLQEAWSERVGVDIVRQAQRQAGLFAREPLAV